MTRPTLVVRLVDLGESIVVDDISAEQEAMYQLHRAVENIDEGIDDGTVLVLKGHLVLEELIRIKIQRTLKNPEYLVKGNLGFYQVLCLARALFDDMPLNDERTSVWDVVEAWNTLRNRLAHRLAPTDTVQILRRIIRADWSHDLGHPDTQAILHFVIGMIAGAIQGSIARDDQERTEKKSAP
jgi:hypothetical protein